jgi:hypothetical protein
MQDVELPVPDESGMSNRGSKREIQLRTGDDGRIEMPDISEALLRISNRPEQQSAAVCRAAIILHTLSRNSNYLEERRVS